MRLRVLIGAGSLYRLTGFGIDVIVALCGAVDAIGPVKARIEPLRRVRRGDLRGQHEAHFVIEGLGVFLAVEIAALPPPIGPGAGEPVENLPCILFRAETLFLRQRRQRVLIGHMPPQPGGDSLFLDRLQLRGDARLAEIFLGENVARNLAPLRRDLKAVQAEHGGTIRIADFARGRAKGNALIGAVPLDGEATLDTHVLAPVSAIWCSLRLHSGTEAETRGPPRRTHSLQAALTV